MKTQVSNTIKKRLLRIASLITTLLCAYSFASTTNPTLFLHGLWADARTWDAMSNALQDRQQTYGGVVRAKWSTDSSGNVVVSGECVTASMASNAFATTDLIKADRPIYLPSCTFPADFYIWQSTDVSMTYVAQLGLYAQLQNVNLTLAQQGAEVKGVMQFIKAQTPTITKFGLVGHSMGGLAARHYLQNLHSSSDLYANDVSDLITIGTPHQGSFVASVCKWSEPTVLATMNACYSADIALFKTWLRAAVNDKAPSVSQAYDQFSAAEACALKVGIYDWCHGNHSTAISQLNPIVGGAIQVMNECATSANPQFCGNPQYTSVGLTHRIPNNVNYTSIVAGGGFSGYEFSSFAPSEHDGAVLKVDQRMPANLLGGATERVVEVPDITAGWLAHVGETSDPNVICVVLGTLGKSCVSVVANNVSAATTRSMNVSGSVALRDATQSATGVSALDVYFEYGYSPSALTGRSGGGVVSVPNNQSQSATFSTAITFPSNVGGQTIYWRACASSVTLAPTGKCSGTQSYVMPNPTLPSGQTSASVTLAAPTSLAPNTATGQAIPITLTWSQVPNATSYRVVVAKAADAAAMPTLSTDAACDVCVWNTVTPDAIVAVPAELLAANQGYVWQVKARNIEQYGAWSSKANLVAAAPTLLTAPTLTAPADVSVVPNSDIRLTWQAVAGATSYRVLVARTASALNLSPYDSNCPTCVFNGISTSLSQTLAASSFVAGETYFWRVKARNSAQYGNLSAIRSFTVGQPSTVCSSSFPSPALAVPAAAGTFTVTVSGREGCAVSVTANQSYCTVSNVPTSFGASGLASVTLSLTANTGTASRSCTLTAGAATYTVTQASSNPAPLVTLSLTSTVDAWQLYVDDGTGNWPFAGSGSRSIPQGTTTKVTAAAQPGYVFTGWYDNSTSALLSTSETYTFVMGSTAKTLRAQFAPSSSYYVYTGTANTPDGIVDDVLWRVTASGMSTWDWQRPGDTVAVPSTASDFRVDCLDTPFALANPASFTQGNGYNPNGYWFSCNYMSKNVARLNLAMRPQAKIAATFANALATLNDGRVVTWGSSSTTSFPNYAAGAIALGWGTRDFILTKPLFVDIVNANGVDASDGFGSTIGPIATKTSTGWKEWNPQSTPASFYPVDVTNSADILLRRQNVSIRQGGRIFSGGTYLATIPTAVDAVRGIYGFYVLRSDGAVVYVPSDMAASNSNCPVRAINTSATSKCVGITPLPELNGVIAISSNNTNAYAVRNDGTVWVWGYASAINGTPVPVPGIATRPSGEYRPVQVPGISGAFDVITSASGATYVRTASGQVWAWGDNTFGRIGLPTTASTTDIWTPHLISGLVGIREIATTPFTSGSLIAVDNSGFVWTIGLLQGSSGNTTAGTGSELTELSTPTRVLCPNGYTGYLNIDNFAANCTQASNLTLNIAATFANVSLLVNGAPVSLPYSGTFTRGQTVRLEALPEVGFGALWAGNLYTSLRVLDVPMTRDWSLELRQGACGSLSLLPPATNGSQVVALSSGAAGQTTVQVYEGSTSASCHWKFETTTDWLSSSGEGYGRGSFVLNYGANPTTASRTGYFKLIGANGTATERMVTQPAGTPDTVPNAFSFATQLALPRSTQAVSESITVTGINAPAIILVSTGSEYSVGCSATFTSAQGTVTNGQTVCVRHTSSTTYSGSVVTTLTIGGVQGTFTSITVSAPVNGVCGTANSAVLTAAPSASALCSAGTASAVTGSGPWTWTCGGSNGGTTASCAAQLAPPTTYTLTVTAGANGAVSPSGSSQRTQGATITVTATPNSGYSFSSWTGYSACSAAATCTFTMPASAVSLTANFAAIQSVPKNVAASLNGGTASASSTVLSSTNPTMFPPASAIDGDRTTVNWDHGGGWANAAPSATPTWPAWLQSTFSSTKTIDRIDVFTIADDYRTAGTPTSASTFSQYGLTDFQVQYWTGSTWQSVGAVAANRCVWRTFTFAPVATTAVRVLVTGAIDGSARVAELEAWEVGATTAANPASSCAATASSNMGTAITTGVHHSCAVIGGSARCWGANWDGQLGTGATYGSSATPVPVFGLSAGASAISASEVYSCAVVSGAVKCWGANHDDNHLGGWLGDGTSVNRTTPTQVVGLTSGVTSLSVNYNNACAVVNGEVKCWGDWYGATPVTINALGSGAITGVAKSYWGACAIVGGGVTCWDDTDWHAYDWQAFGLAGPGFAIDFTGLGLPYAVPGLSSNVTAISGGNLEAAGYGGLCAVQAGALKCWRGRGDTPVAVQGMQSGVTAVSVGGWDTVCSIKGGGAWCWGSNSNGQLGDMTTNDSAVPVAVVGLETGVTAIATNYQHSCAIQNGAPVCWGANFSGQLGSGSAATASAPRGVPVPALTALPSCVRPTAALREPVRLSRYLGLVRGGGFAASTLASGQDAATLSANALAHYDAGVMAYDFNGDGFITAGVDDVLYARYALGFRGAALTSGLNVGTSRSTAQIEAALAACQ